MAQIGSQGLLLALFLFAPSILAGDEPMVPKNFQSQNLVAWCIVPFDANPRSPAARASMVRQLGMRRVAYDWREEHVVEFESEILQYKRNEIEYFAFWSWHDAIEPLIRKHKIKPQIWLTCPSPKDAAQNKRIQLAIDELLPMVQKTQALGLKLGLYNHGGWGGEPANMVEVCKLLRARHDAKHIGIVYNFHHGHDHITDFPVVFERMKPFLLCLNLNGMRSEQEVVKDPSRNKIVPIGRGEHEAAMIRYVVNSDYDGPIGIIGHRHDADVKTVLRQNLDGLEQIVTDRPSR